MSAHTKVSSDSRQSEMAENVKPSRGLPDRHIRPRTSVIDPSSRKGLKLRMSTGLLQVSVPRYQCPGDHYACGRLLSLTRSQSAPVEESRRKSVRLRRHRARRVACRFAG